MAKVELKKLIEKMDLKNLTPDVDYNGKWVETADINRPALQLTGFFEHFARLTSCGRIYCIMFMPESQ